MALCELSASAKTRARTLVTRPRPRPRLRSRPRPRPSPRPRPRCRRCSLSAILLLPLNFKIFPVREGFITQFLFLSLLFLRGRRLRASPPHPHYLG